MGIASTRAFSRSGPVEERNHPDETAALAGSHGPFLALVSVAHAQEGGAPHPPVNVLDGDSDTPNIRWEISIRPDSNANVTAELPVTTDCNAQGAICAEDGSVLSSPLKFTVKGPPLTASFESVPTSHNGSDNFKFRIAFSEEPKSGFSYTTMRDHAFTVTGGSVTGARRLVSGKNLRWEIVVSPDSNGDVTITLPATTDCDAQGAICADGDKKLSEELERTVSGPGQ